MTGLGDVFGSLKATSQLQLLLAFIACIAYAFAQGSLLASKGRRLAWFTTLCAAVGFTFESDDWTHAIVLLGFAVAGMGSFVAVVWLTSRALGFRRASSSTSNDSLDSDLSSIAPADARSRVSQPGDHAHSI